MINNILKFAPLKLLTKKKVPNNLIYEPSSNQFSYYKTFTLFNSKGSPKEYATIELYKDSIDRDGFYDVPSLYISHLEANVKGKGLGTTLINFAKQYSKKNGCYGNIHLDAAKIKANTPSPHVFYRKNGFSTHSEILNQELDSIINNKNTPSNKYFSPAEMFYPEFKK